jgi:histidine triad (HIT) family protein
LDDSCVFCRIVRGEIPSSRVLEDDYLVVIRDANPQAPVHVLIIPKRHIAGLIDLPGDDMLWNKLIGAVQHVADSMGLASGFRSVVNQGADGGQTVAHLHIHVLGGRFMQWPPG